MQGYFVESEDTVAGTAEHRRAGRRGRTKGVEGFEWTALLPPALHTAKRRDVTLESSALGVRGKTDLLEVRDGSVTVVEMKHGAGPLGSEHRWNDEVLPYDAWPSDVAQTGLYMALLREAGVPCSEGVVLYRKNRRQAHIEWSAELERFLHRVVREAREVENLSTPPEPLVANRKCKGCSLNGVCLPDEHHALKSDAKSRPKLKAPLPQGDHRTPLHVMTPGATVSKAGQSICVRMRNGTEEHVLLKDVSQVALYGQVHITEPCTRHLLLEDVSIAHHTGAGRLVGMTLPLQTRNVGIRRAQYRTADDESRCLEAAKAWVVSKIRNQRTLLRRNRKKTESQVDIDGELERLKVARAHASSSTTLDTLRGHEGDAAAAYFQALPNVLPAPWNTELQGRTRRPPKDRVNALLSFGYALLVREATAAAARVGLDPMLGLFHTMIPGRPALALDVMEPFRPAWVDTCVVRMLSTKAVTPDDFLKCGEGTYLSDRGRRALVRAFERRGDEITTHPRFGSRMSYRRILELEARVLAKWLLGEIPAFEPMWTR